MAQSELAIGKPPNFDVSLGAQIRCVERELAFRRIYYPKRVRSGVMARITCDREIALMTAALETLCDLTHKRGMMRTELERIVGALDHATHTIDVLHARSIAFDLLESLKGGD
jgi:hypothetical protein